MPLPSVTLFDVAQVTPGVAAAVRAAGPALMTRYVPYLQFLSEGGSVQFTEDLAGPEDNAQCDDRAYGYSYDYWRRADLRYQGVDLGTLLRDQLARALARRLKDHTVLQRALQGNRATHLRVVSPPARVGYWRSIVSELAISASIDTAVGVQGEGAGIARSKALARRILKRFGSPVFLTAVRLINASARWLHPRPAAIHRIVVLDIPLLRYVFDRFDSDPAMEVVRLEQAGSPTLFGKLLEGPLRRYAFVDCIAYRAAWQEARRAAWARIRALDHEVSHDSVSGQVYRLARPEIWHLLRNWLPDYLRWIDSVRRELGRLRPLLVVLHEDCSPKERTIVLTARTLGIRSLVVQHGVVSEPRGHAELFADIHAVWGDFHRRRYESFGNAPERLCVTGHPFRDGRAPLAPGMIDSDRAAVRRMLGIPPGARTVTIAARNAERTASAFRHVDSELKYLHVVHNALRGMKDTVLLLKLHPRDFQTPSYRRLIRLLPGDPVTVLVQEPSLDSVLKISDVVICPGSTAICEAVEADRPVIFFDVTGRTDIPRYDEFPAILVPRGSGELRRIVERILDGGGMNVPEADRRRFLEDFFYRRDGAARDRIVALIKELIT